jgi:hypothetical protein
MYIIIIIRANRELGRTDPDSRFAMLDLLILYIDYIIVYNAFYSKLTFYIIKDRCQIHALKVIRSPVWLLLHKLSSPHYRYIRKMRRGDRLPLTQTFIWIFINLLLFYGRNYFLHYIQWVSNSCFISMRWWWWCPHCTRATRMVGFL